MWIAIAGVMLFVMLIIVQSNKYEDKTENKLDRALYENMKLREQMDRLKGLADEQNYSLMNMKAGRYEEAFAGFENVKDEIERLYNEKELNTADNENV